MKLKKAGKTSRNLYLLFICEIILKFFVIKSQLEFYLWAN